MITGKKKQTTVLTADLLVASISTRTHFAGRNYSGGAVPGLGDLDFGILPQRFRESASEARYVVCSYVTPIGWELEGGGWVVPNQYYGNTTSRQQNCLLEALTILRRPVKREV